MFEPTFWGLCIQGRGAWIFSIGSMASHGKILNSGSDCACWLVFFATSALTIWHLKTKLTS
jgi:hypothetical protein